jgi:hypothetical protein
VLDELAVTLPRPLDLRLLEEAPGHPVVGVGAGAHDVGLELVGRQRGELLPPARLRLAHAEIGEPKSSRLRLFGFAPDRALPQHRHLEQHLAGAALGPHAEVSRSADQFGVLRLARVRL